MPHPLHTSVEDLIEGLRSIQTEAITSERVSELLTQVRPNVDALRPYSHWRDSFYTRNLIYRDDIFEVMAICWKAGQKTPVHTHNGSLGWMTIAQGEIEIHQFKWIGCDHPERQNVVGMDCLAGGGHIELERLGTELCGVNGPVAVVDKQNTIHCIDNSDPARAGCVSLHIYAPPIDSCVGFDVEQQKCFRKNLSYFSKYGKVEEQSSSTPLKIIA